MKLPASWTLLVGRICEQAALGLAVIVLAWRLEVADFGVTSLVLVANSLAVTSAHYGVGQMVLSLVPGARLDRLVLRRTRMLNSALGLAGCVLAVLVDGELRWALCSMAVVWGAAGEVFIQKAAAVNLGDAGRVARAELLGAAGLLGVLLVQPTQSPVLGLGLALLAQHLLQGLTLRRSIGPLLTDLPRSGWTAHILMSQVLAFVAANVDYVVAWWILGAGPLGLYSLAFRIGNLPQAQVSNVAGRLALVDLARDQSTERYVAFVNRLFTLGVLLMALTIGCAPFLPVLGQRWDAAVPVLVLVSFGTPWRIIMGTAGSVAIAAGAARRLSRWETVRVIWTAAMLAPAAGLGSNPFVAATTISTAWSSTVLHFLAASASGRRLPRWLIPAALATSVVAIVGAMMLPEPS